MDKLSWSNGVRLLSGILMFILGLWGGCYVVYELGVLHWTALPAILTGIILCGGGWFVAGFAISELTD